MIGRSGFDTPTFAGSARQMAPELIHYDVGDDPPRVTTKETDVYTFSMAALEVRDPHTVQAWHILWEPSGEPSTMSMLFILALS